MASRDNITQADALGPVEDDTDLSDVGRESTFARKRPAFGAPREKVQAGLRGLRDITRRWQVQTLQGGICETWRLLRLDGPVEIAAFDCGDIRDPDDPRSRITGHAIRYVGSADEAGEAAMEVLGQRGHYLVPARLRAGVEAVYDAGAWGRAAKGTAREPDVVWSAALVIDCDPKRPANTSATRGQWAAAVGVAGYVRELLAVAGCPDSALGIGHSGNGAHIHIYTDVEWSAEVKDLRVRVLRAVGVLCDYIQGPTTVTIDQAMADGARYIPLYGTAKRKGGRGHADRPWRQTALVGPDNVEPLTLDAFRRLVLALEAMCAPSAVEAWTASRQDKKTRPVVPAPSKVPFTRSDGLFDQVNKLPMSDVARVLGVSLDVCPGCGKAPSGKRIIAHEGSGIDIWHCFKEGCSARPDWTNIRLILDTKNIDDNKRARFLAVSEVARELAIDVPKRVRGTRPTARAGLAPRVAGGSPTSADATPGEVEGEADERPEIEITTDEHIVNDQAAEALAADTTVYQRGYELVRVLREDGVAPDKVLKRTPGTPKISRIQRATLREHLAANARWVTAKKVPGTKGDKPEFALVPAHPPGWSVDAVLARGFWPGLRTLTGVVETPVLRPDGSILSVPGYDVATGLLYIPNGEYPPIPERPTHDDARVACETLLEIVCDVPFESDAHRAAWFAGTLTPFARPALSGPSPVFVVDANTRGTGKNLALDAIGIIVSGRDMSRMAHIKDNEELDKRVTSIALSGDTTVLIDNLRGGFGGAVWEAVATAMFWRGRRLSVSEDTIMPLLVTWYATANNAEIIGDMSRRVVLIRLFTKDEQPEDRDPNLFRHPDLLKWVREQRPRLVAAALTVLRAYVVAGRPPQNCRFGSFESWAGLVASAIVWCGHADPCTTRQAVEENAGSDRSKLGAVLVAWDEQYGDEPQKLATVLRTIDDESREARREGTATDTLPLTALEDAFTGVSNDGRRPSPQQLGKLLGHLRGRVVNGLYLDNTATDRKGTHLWRVLRAGDAGDAGIDPTLTSFRNDTPSNPQESTWRRDSNPLKAETIQASPASPAPTAVRSVVASAGLPDNDPAWRRVLNAKRLPEPGLHWLVNLEVVRRVATPDGPRVGLSAHAQGQWEHKTAFVVPDDGVDPWLGGELLVLDDGAAWFRAEPEPTDV